MVIAGRGRSAFNGKDGQIRARVTPHHTGHMRFAVGGVHAHFPRALDDVVVGDNDARFVHQHATSRALCDAAGGHAQHAEPGVALVCDKRGSLHVDHGIHRRSGSMDKRISARRCFDGRRPIG